MRKSIDEKYTDEYDPNKKCKILMVFDDVIADMLSSKNLSSSNRTIYQKQENKHFSRFYHTISLYSTNKH